MCYVNGPVVFLSVSPCLHYLMVALGITLNKNTLSVSTGVNIWLVQEWKSYLFLISLYPLPLNIIAFFSIGLLFPFFFIFPCYSKISSSLISFPFREMLLAVLSGHMCWQKNSHAFPSSDNVLIPLLSSQIVLVIQNSELTVLSALERYCVLPSGLCGFSWETRVVIWISFSLTVMLYFSQVAFDILL